MPPSPLQGGRAAAETLVQAGGSLPPPEPEEADEPVFGPAAPWELEQQQQAAAAPAAQPAAVGPAAEGEAAGMAVEEAAAEAAAAAAAGPAVAGPPVAGPAVQGVVPAAPANIMKRELAANWLQMQSVPGTMVFSLVSCCLPHTLPARPSNPLLLSHEARLCSPLNRPAGEGQQRVLSELEREFNSGLARRNRTTGLGA